MFRKIIPILLFTLATTTPLRAFDNSCYNWTGLYLGGYVGGAWGERAIAKEKFPFNPGTGSFDNDLDNSWIGGGTIGYNYQCRCWLLGIEDEVGYLKVEGNTPDPNSAGLATVASAKIGSWYDVLALRVGYVSNCFLLYAKVGGAVTRISGKVDDDFMPAFPVHASGHKYTKSWVAGLGLEYGFCKRWSAKAEYLFINVNDTVTSKFNSPGVGATPSSGAWGHEFHGVHTAKFGINYHFSLCCFGR